MPYGGFLKAKIEVHAGADNVSDNIARISPNEPRARLSVPLKIKSALRQRMGARFRRSARLVGSIFAPQRVIRFESSALSISPRAKAIAAACSTA